MSLYISFRQQATAGGVGGPTALEGDGTAHPLSLRQLDDTAMRVRVAGKHVLFGVHGFNVALEAGARSLGRLEQELVRAGWNASSELFIGVLWPGDSWLPIVNYPFEGDDAIACGQMLASYCGTTLSAAQSFSFASHSLGGRLILEAVQHLDRQARCVCLTAAAINKDALTAEYAGARSNASAVALLASRKDLVLRLAYPVGDPIADLLHDDHTPFQPALGYGGPPLPAAAPIAAPWQIDPHENIGHLDYMPPSAVAPPAPAALPASWSKVAGFIDRAFHKQPQTWP